MNIVKCKYCMPEHYQATNAPPGNKWRCLNCHEEQKVNSVHYIGDSKQCYEIVKALKLRIYNQCNLK